MIFSSVLAALCGWILISPFSQAEELPPLDRFRFGIYGAGRDNHNPEVAEKKGLPFTGISSDDDGSGVETRIYPSAPGIPESEWPIVKLP